MPKERAQPRVEDDPELAEFASLDPIPQADPHFRERLSNELWELLNELVAAEAER